MFVVGFATEDEIATLLKSGYDVEEAKGYGRVVGPEGNTLMLPPKPSPSGTRAVAIFLDASLNEVVRNHEHGSYNPDGFVDRGEHHRHGEERVWPELPFDEEFLRIVLLQSRLLGKDTTVEPFTSYQTELEWRRTDKHVLARVGERLSVEQVAARHRTLEILQRGYIDQQHLAGLQLRELCSHRYDDDGKDASSGVPVSGERWCRTCGSQYD